MAEPRERTDRIAVIHAVYALAWLALAGGSAWLIVLGTGELAQLLLAVRARR